MAGSDNEFEADAAKAIAALDRDRARAVQLSMFTAPDPVVEDGPRGPGRPAGAKNKASSQVRRWLAERGFRAPEDRLAKIAGLGSDDDALTRALANATRLFAHVAERAENRVYMPDRGHVILGTPWKPAPENLIDMIKFFYSAELRALESLMPYVAPKASPDVVQQVAVSLMLPAGAADPAPGQAARRVLAGPPPMPGEIVENQPLAEEPRRASDNDRRTD